MEVPKSGSGARTVGDGLVPSRNGLVPSRVGKTAPADSGDHAPQTGPTQADGWLRTTPLAVFFFLGRTVKSLVSNVANLAASAAGIVILVKQHVLLAAVVVALGLVALVVGRRAPVLVLPVSRGRTRCPNPPRGAQEDPTRHAFRPHPGDQHRTVADLPDARARHRSLHDGRGGGGRGPSAGGDARVRGAVARPHRCEACSA